MKTQRAIDLFFKTLAEDNNIQSEVMHMSTECEIEEAVTKAAEAYVSANTTSLTSCSCTCRKELGDLIYRLETIFKS